MKRSGPLERRTPLKAKTGLKARKQPNRRKPLKPQSEKRRSERDERQAVREATFKRANYRCEMEHLVPDVKCWQPGGVHRALDVHERAARATTPGSHLDETVTMAVCRAHHDWIDSHIPEAEVLGVRIRGT